MKANKLPKLAQIVRGILTVLFIAAILHYAFTVDRIKLLTVLKAADWKLLFPAAGIIVVVLYLKALRLKLLTPSRMLMPDLFRIQCISILLATFSPGRVGEIVKIWFLKEHGLSTGAALYIFFLERITDVLILLWFSLLFYFFLHTPNLGLGIVSAVVFMVFFLFMVLWVKGVIRIPLPHGVQKLMLKLQVEPNVHRNLPVSVLLSVVIWMTEGLFFLLMTRIMDGTEVTFFESIGIIAVSGIASLLSVLPMGLGSVDLSIVYLLHQSGMSSESITALLLIMRTTVVSTLTIAGISSSGFSLNPIRFFITRAKESMVLNHNPLVPTLQRGNEKPEFYVIGKK